MHSPYPVSDFVNRRAALILQLNLQPEEQLQLAGIWKKLNSLEFLFPKELHSGFYSVETFHDILKREQARCDRKRNELSLIIIDTSKLRPGAGNLRYLKKVLKNRLRFSDEIGWYDQKKMGVILPDTPVDGAVKVTEEIRNRLGSDYPTASFKAFNYPEKSESDKAFWKKRY